MKPIDKELMELAAKAAGYDVFTAFGTGGPLAIKKKEGDSIWNPLEEDGDALQLAVKLGIFVDYYAAFRHELMIAFEADFRPSEATRRAIVKTASKMVKEN